MFHRNARNGAVAGSPGHLAQERLGGLAGLSVPMQACCRPARPMYEVVMPPTATRLRPVDLWLCGHHCRTSRQALAAAGAQVYRLGRDDSRWVASEVSHAAA